METLIFLNIGIFIVSGLAVILTAIKKSTYDLVEASIFGLSGLILLGSLIYLVVKG
ncbi:hypothetical protein [Bacillus toyonensis]|uniref:hypothetical protein n=1 Tax=Bacillus toyonensis TaxID=155322 RepID=UPI00159BBF6B|nr:hypothetical protein [Bacillus toyonensis]